MIVTCCTLNNIGYDDPCSALRDFIINTDTGHMMSMLYMHNGNQMCISLTTSTFGDCINRSPTFSTILWD